MIGMIFLASTIVREMRALENQPFDDRRESNFLGMIFLASTTAREMRALENQPFDDRRESNFLIQRQWDTPPPLSSRDKVIYFMK